ncbi:MAG: hypothetical protein H0T46_14710 [Deltaproteobacteria bacterium]|nr:hypothetical protein [Deltaproteobacteria bacterium]
MSRLAFLVLLVAVGCTDDSGPPPLAKVPGKLGKIAVGTSSLFAIDTTDNTIVEINIADGSVIGKLTTVGAVTDLSAAGDLVAWVEKEGNNGKVKRRKAGAIDALGTLTFMPRVLVTDEGVFYSDTGIIGLWADEIPTRVGSPAGAATLIGVDSSYAYTVEAGMSVQKYDRRMDMKELVVASTQGATVKGGMLAYRTGEGVRIRDLFTKFDALFGAPPADYPCELLLAGRAVMCGKYRALEGETEVLLEDPVAGYAAVGRDLYWVKTAGANSEIYKTDSELMLKDE